MQIGLQAFDMDAMYVMYDIKSSIVAFECLMNVR